MRTTSTLIWYFNNCTTGKAFSESIAVVAISLWAVCVGSVSPANATQFSVTPIFDIQPGSTPSPEFTVLGDDLFFVSIGFNGKELFKTDGTTVSEVADIYPGPTGSNPAIMAVLGDQLVFRAQGLQGEELYVTDGNFVTEFDIRIGPDSSQPRIESWFTEPAIIDDFLYFSARGANGTELFKTDGTSIVEFDINTGLTSSHPRNFYVFDGKVIFTAFGANGREPYKTDGNQVSQLADLHPGPAGGSIHILGILKNEVYFFGGGFLNKTDGSVVEPIVEAHVAFNETGPVLFNEEFYLNNSKTDGLSITPLKVKVEFGGMTFESFTQSTQGFFEYRNELYFEALVFDSNIYKTDGTIGETFGEDLSNNRVDPSFTQFADDLYFTAERTNGVELFKTNGQSITEFDINTGPEDSRPDEMTPFGASLLFRATGPQGNELYYTDGETISMIDIYPGPTSSHPGAFFEFKDELYFIATGVDGRKVFKLAIVPEPTNSCLVWLGALAYIAAFRIPISHQNRRSVT